MKRGFVFSLDAVIGVSLLLLLALFLVGMSFTYTSPELTYQRHYFTGKDVLNVVEKTKITYAMELQSVQDMLDEGILVEEDKDKTILDIIGSLWASDNATLRQKAADLAKEFLNLTFPQRLGYSISFNGDVIYQKNITTNETFLSKHSTIASGFEKGKPVSGFVSRVVVTKANKLGSSYGYFGGFEGSGNITKVITLPQFDNIISFYMEMDAGDDFSLFINNKYSGSYIRNSVGNFSADKWNVSSQYFPFISEGGNNITLDFGGQETDYIGGGYIKISYNTTQFVTEKAEAFGLNATDRYWFPGINGIINLYSALYVPGMLNNMTAYLHYFNNISVNGSGIDVFAFIGGSEIYRNKTLGEHRVFLNDSYLRSKLNFSALTKGTIPIRIGTEQIAISGGVGISDSVLITDMSGSMSTCDVSSNGTCDCSGPCRRTRINVAKEVDKDFVNNILVNFTGNRIGLTGYGGTLICSSRPMINDSVLLNNEIGNYSASCGATCIACGVFNATEKLRTDKMINTLIKAGSGWVYNTSNPAQDPPNDANGSLWFNLSYNDSSWVSGNAILGFETPFSSSQSCNYQCSAFEPCQNNLQLWTKADDDLSDGIALDSSSSGRNGTCSGANCPAYNLAGGWDSTGAYNFDGSNDYLNLGGIDLSGNTITITAWINSDNLDNPNCSSRDCRIISKEPGTSTGVQYLSLSTIRSGSNTYLRFSLRTGNPGSTATLIGSSGASAPLSNNVWVHAAAVYNGTHITLYKNGIQVGSTAKTGNITQNDSMLTFIGANPYNAGSPWDGRIENVRIYNRNLSQPEIVVLSNSTARPANCGNAVLDLGEICDANTQACNTVQGYYPNVNTGIGNNGGNYYFRKKFNISSVNELDYSELYILSDNRADVYLNGNLVVNETENHNATYWNKPTEIFFDGFESGNFSTKGWVMDSNNDGGVVAVGYGEAYKGAYSLKFYGDGSGPNSIWVEKSLNLSGRIGASMSYYWAVEDFEYSDGDYGYLDIYDGQWHNGVRIHTNDGNDHSTIPNDYTKEVINLGIFNLIDGFKIRFRATPVHSEALDTFLVDNVTVIESVTVNSSGFINGENIMAVRLLNNDNFASKFDLELNATVKRFKSMLVMSDGQANYCVPGRTCNNNDAKTDVIQRACQARDEYGITVYSVAFGSAADIDTLNKTACWNCTTNTWIPNCNRFFYSSDADELKNIYQAIAEDVVNISQAAQILNISGNISRDNTLYTDSYVEFNYTSGLQSPAFGEATFTIESPRFSSITGNSTITNQTMGTKEGIYFIPNGTKVIDAKVTSYSAEYWTDRLFTMAQNEPDWRQVFRLANFSNDYTVLGDPYFVNIPVEFIQVGINNSAGIGVGAAAADKLGGSPDSRVIFTLLVGGLNLQGYSGVFSKGDGSTVTVYYDINGDNSVDGSTIVSVGSKPSDKFDPQNDSIDDAFMRLLDNLNIIYDTNVGDYGEGTSGDPYDGLNQTNPIDLQISSEVAFDSSKISGISSLWGPANVEIRVWG